jgi:hypothetical protein
MALVKMASRHQSPRRWRMGPTIAHSFEPRLVGLGKKAVFQYDWRMGLMIFRYGRGYRHRTFGDRSRTEIALVGAAAVLPRFRPTRRTG